MNIGFGNLTVAAKYTITRYWKHCAAVIAVTAMGSLSALIDQSTSIEAEQTGGRWNVPIRGPTTLTSELDHMLANPIFGGAPFERREAEPQLVEDAPLNKYDTSRDWRFIGIITEGQTRVAVVLDVQSNRVEEFEQGSTLPGGETLMLIDSNSIQIERQSEVLDISLFQDKRNTVATAED